MPPRHLYTPYVYQVWGGMPYEAGDYLTHGVLSLLLPGYEDASYFHDERGFLSPTPFGDMTDCLLSATRRCGCCASTAWWWPRERWP